MTTNNYLRDVHSCRVSLCLAAVSRGHEGYGQDAGWRRGEGPRCRQEGGGAPGGTEAAGGGAEGQACPHGGGTGEGPADYQGQGGTNHFLKTLPPGKVLPHPSNLTKPNLTTDFATQSVFLQMVPSDPVRDTGASSSIFDLSLL